MKQSSRSTPKQGKGSKHRPTNFNQFWLNYDAIFKKHGQDKATTTKSPHRPA